MKGTRPSNKTRSHLSKAEDLPLGDHAVISRVLLGASAVRSGLRRDAYLDIVRFREPGGQICGEDGPP
jgi:hypothetical protein